MQTKRENRQGRLVMLPPLEEFVPADHRLRGLNRVLDLGFVHEVVRDKYCQDNGRPSVAPEVVIRLFLLQAIEGISHVRELMRQVQVNLAYRWFIGYELDEALPDHSTLSRALDRLGDGVFNDLFALNDTSVDSHLPLSGCFYTISFSSPARFAARAADRPSTKVAIGVRP